MMKSRYNKYSQYMKDIYGSRVQKVTVDGGFSCPNRDGSISTGGCSYCNNYSFSPALAIGDLSIKEQVEIGIAGLKRRYNVDKFLVYFQSYSNTYAPLSKLKSLYEEALSHPEVVGLSIGTRPDCIDLEKIEYLEQLAKHSDITIEYGIESFSDETLKKINRGHDVETLLNALELTAGRGIKICGHVILGFPWESRDFLIETARRISQLPIDFLKLHQLHLVKDTPMAEEYLKNPYKLMSEDEYISVLVEFIENLRPDIVLQRIFGEAPENMLVSPSWGKTVSELVLKFQNILDARDTYQGRLFTKR